MKTSLTSDSKLRAEYLAMFLLLLLFLMVGSCGPRVADKMGDAQSCLDHAAASEVNDCLAKIEGLETPAAYSIRCSGYFMREGFLDPNTIINAFKTLSTGSNQATQFANFMSIIVFKNSADWDVNNADAKATLDACYKSGGKAMTFLAAFAYFSTASIVYANKSAAGIDQSTNSTAMALALAAAFATAKTDTLNATSGAAHFKTALGSIINSANTISCLGSTKIDANTCTTFANAISRATTPFGNLQVGQSFLNQF